MDCILFYCHKNDKLKREALSSLCVYNQLKSPGKEVL
jgi:hypothetical protein